MLRTPITEADALNHTLKYFNDDHLSSDVFIRKYCLKDSDDNYFETDPDMMHSRLANQFARVNVKYAYDLDYIPTEDDCWIYSGWRDTQEASATNYYDQFKNYKYICPQGSPMFALGNPFSICSSSNCFVIDSPENSYGGILKTDQEMIQLAKRRGGIGFDISTLAPAGTKITNAARLSSGMVSFMERYSTSIREVAQEGRRGALILTSSIHHPDIEDFIRSKLDLTKVTGANITVMFSDVFMAAVVNNTDYEQRWPIDSDDPKVTKMVSARQVWDLFVECAWGSAEPGAIFIDTMQNYHGGSGYPSMFIASVNPCGELPQPADDSCRLVALNLFSYVLDPFTDDPAFNWVVFKSDTRDAMRIGDNLVDLEVELVDKIIAKVESDPETIEAKAIELALWKRIRAKAIEGRRIGLGITGLGDMLASLGIRYGSEESIVFVDKLFGEFAVAAHRESIQLAKERGPFGAFDFEKEKDNTYLEVIFKRDPSLREEYLKYGRRNVSCLTIAPTGSLSTQTQTTSGIEPAFMVEYKRRRKILSGEDVSIDFIDDLGDKWTEYNVVHHKFKMWQDVTGKTKVEDSPYWKATAMDLDWISSIEIQAAAQKWIDHSISKTANFPKEATKELVSEAYIKAWKSGCKGFTVYRDGCRDGVLISNLEESIPDRDAIERPEYLDCKIYKSRIKGEDWIMMVGSRDGTPYEVFGGRSTEELLKTLEFQSPRLRKRKFKSVNSKYDLYDDEALAVSDIVSSLANPDYSLITRLVSLGLRHGAKPNFLAEQLRKDKDSSLDSFANVLARTLKKYIADGTEVSSGSMEGCLTPGMCKLIYQDGCISCGACGLSKCS